MFEAHLRMRETRPGMRETRPGMRVAKGPSFQQLWFS